jgi:UDP-N-acetylmuramate dehydrogenase
MKLQENIPLARMTTLGVGGAARYYVEATSGAGVREALEFATARDLPLCVMGGGSNLVVADAGFSGLALKIALRGTESHNHGEFRVYRVAAGEVWDELVSRAAAADCAGIECLSGIPGTVGATPVQNVGAYGQEVSDTIEAVEVLDRAAMGVHILRKGECGFEYRSSRFNTTDRDRYIILSVTFALPWNGEPNLRYADLQRVFGGGAKPSLQQVREAVLEIRRSKSMVLGPDDENRRSVGSFFKNPVVPTKGFEELDQRLRSRGLEMPSYPAGEGTTKLSAAWLVEQAGFHKGYSRGAVGISTRHSLAIVNRGGATAAEVVALKNEIQARVMSEFGIELTPEPVFVGF